MPARKGSTCFVPLCKGGYKSSEVKVSLFQAPTDPVCLQEWSRNIKRDDKVLDNTCVVCSRHFDERYIQRTFKHVINGEVVELERKRPVLTDDAVLTIFPDAPLYFTKHVRKRRKERNLANHYAPPPKRMALDEGMPDCELTDSVDVRSASETSAHPFSNVSPLSDFAPKLCCLMSLGNFASDGTFVGKNAEMCSVTSTSHSQCARKRCRNRLKHRCATYTAATSRLMNFSWPLKVMHSLR